MLQRRSPGGLTPEQITSGPLLPMLIRLSIPLVASNVLQNSYDLVNMFWLGRLGEGAVAAVAIGFPVLFLVSSIAFGFNIAGTAMVAQGAGAGDQPAVNRTANQVIMLMTAMGALLTLVGMAAGDLLLRLMGTPAEVFADAHVYLMVSFWGQIPMFLFWTTSSILRGWGDTITPFRMMLAAILLNLFLDPLLIFGLDLGVAGAAYASLVSRLAAACWGLWDLFGGRKGVTLSLGEMKPDWPLIRVLMQQSLPASAGMILRSLEHSLTTGVVARLGATAIAAYGLLGRLGSVTFFFAMAFSMAATTTVGQNLGAKREDRAVASGWWAIGLAGGICALLGIAAALFAGPIIAVFGMQGEVYAEAVRALRIFAIGFPFVAAAVVVSGALQGAGQMVTSMVLAGVSGIGLRFPLSVLAALGGGILWVWWSFQVSLVLGAALSLAVWRAGRWSRPRMMAVTGDQKDTVAGSATAP